MKIRLIVGERVKIIAGEEREMDEMESLLISIRPAVWRRRVKDSVDNSGAIADSTVMETE